VVMSLFEKKGKGGPRRTCRNAQPGFVVCVGCVVCWV
jgi:hypothetical protein